MIRLSYWRKLLNMVKERLPKVVYEWELRVRGGNWSKYTEKLLRELELGEYWERQEVKEGEGEWNAILGTKIQKREETEWRNNMEKRPKLRTYSTIKKDLVSEEYLKT